MGRICTYWSLAQILPLGLSGGAKVRRGGGGGEWEKKVDPSSNVNDTSPGLAVTRLSRFCGRGGRRGRRRPREEGSKKMEREEREGRREGGREGRRRERLKEKGSRERGREGEENEDMVVSLHYTCILVCKMRKVTQFMVITI